MYFDILTKMYQKLMKKYEENSKLTDKINISIAKNCMCCNKETHELVKHHDHFSGKFIGFVCNSCNAKIIKPDKLVIFLHNLKGYDSHFIIKYGLKYLNVDKDGIHVLGKSKEKIFRIEIIAQEASLIFLDSYSHLPFSLSDLVRDFVKEPKFKEFLPIPEYKHKEAYPYEWMDSFHKFDIPFLPPRETFYSRITEKRITEEEYAGANIYCKVL